MKIGNEIITSHDIEQEINYLKALNPGLKQIDKDELLVVPRDLLQRIYKKRR